jgi:formylglycine-generating enzyme required for sulfatase activity
MKHFLLCLAIVFVVSALCAQHEVAAPPTSSIRIITKFGGDAYLDGEFYQSLFAKSNVVWTDVSVGEHNVELRNPKGVFSHNIIVTMNQEALLDFDNPPKANPKPQTSEHQLPQFEPKQSLKPIVNEVSTGKGKLEIKSSHAGDVYLGGKYIGSIKANKRNKLNQLPAGDFSLEFFAGNLSYRQEISIVHKGRMQVNISEIDMLSSPHDLIYIPGGTYFMGTQFIDRSEHERPRHQVSLAPLLIGKTEVNQDLWQEVMGFNPSVRTDARQPVTNVSWYQVLEFCNQLSLRDGLSPCYTINKSFPDANNISNFDSLRYSVSCNWDASGYRLPTEAEWEYAAKCGDSYNKLKFSGSNRINEVAWYLGNSGDRVQACAQKKANAFGLYDMSGNVFEWCWDYWGPYNDEAVSNPKGAKSGAYRVIRGGSWQSEPDMCNPTYRGGNDAADSSNDLGFRIVRNARVINN